MPSQASRAHGDRGAPPSFPHWCSWVLHLSLCALDDRGAQIQRTERPQTKTSQVTQNGVVRKGTLIFSCSFQAHQYNFHQFYDEYTNVTHVFRFISSCIGQGFMVATWLYTMSLMSAPSSPSPTCGTGWVHSADLTGVDTFHCQSSGFNLLVCKSVRMTLPQIQSKCTT